VALVHPFQPGDPRRLGRWRLLGRLGAGGMGVVYLGRRRGRRLAAVKVPRAELHRDQSYRARFQREATAASRFVSRHTARVLDVGGHGRTPLYLATEYVEGPTLTEAVHTDGPLSGDRLWSFARDVAAATVTMHAAGVTHRDLTPGNVILGRWGPKVIDFGIARADDSRTLTAVGFPVGTPGWMAPEQARGERAGPAADVFAWGALVAFAATGRQPFGEGRADAVLYRVVHQAPDLLGLDEALVPIVTRALDKDASRRPRPEDVLHALSGGEELPATTVPARPTRTAVMPSSLRRPTRRRRVVRQVLAALGVLALLAGAAALTWLVARPDTKTGAVEVGRRPASTTSSATSTRPPVTRGDPPPATASSDYCTLASGYRDRLNKFQSDFDNKHGALASQEDYDREFAKFAADNLDFVQQVREAAPRSIAGEVGVVVGAFERAASGDSSSYDTDAYAAAAERVATYESTRCGVTSGL
jgi:serine/threonine protein kinase